MVYSPQKSRNHWPFSDKNNLITVTVKPQLSSNSIRVLLNAALNGLGVARLPLFAIQEHVDNETLHIVLSDYEPPGIPVYAVFAPGRIIPAKVQAFVRFLEEIH